MPQRPTPRPSRAPSSSKRPMPRPSTREEREAAERGDRAARRDAGMKSGGKVQKKRIGGKLGRGMMTGRSRGPGGGRGAPATGRVPVTKPTPPGSARAPAPEVKPARMKSGGKAKKMAKGGKTTRRRTDAETTRNMQRRANERMVDGLQQSRFASGGVREGMAYGRYPGTEGDRIQSEREEERAAARRRSPAVVARRNENEVGGRKAGGQMKTKKMAKGGMCRGMGAATRGGQYKSS